MEIISKSNSVNHIRMFRLLWILLILFMVISIVPAVIWWYPNNVWPFHPVDFLGTEGVPKQIEAGESIKYKLLVNKHTTLTPTITRFLVCMKNPSEEIPLTPSTPGSSKIKDKQKMIRVVIPSWIEPDQCYVRNLVNYNYFGFKDVESEYSTPWFNVLPNKNKQTITKINNFVDSRVDVIKKNDKIYKAREKVFKAREHEYKEKVKR